MFTLGPHAHGRSLSSDQSINEQPDRSTKMIIGASFNLKISQQVNSVMIFESVSSNDNKEEVVASGKERRIFSRSRRER